MILLFLSFAVPAILHLPLMFSSTKSSELEGLVGDEPVEEKLPGGRSGGLLESNRPRTALSATHQRGGVFASQPAPSSEYTDW